MCLWPQLRQQQQQQRRRPLMSMTLLTTSMYQMLSSFCYQFKKNWWCFCVDNIKIIRWEQRKKTDKQIKKMKKNRAKERKHDQIPKKNNNVIHKKIDKNERKKLKKKFGCTYTHAVGSWFADVMKWSWNFFFHGFPLHIKQTRTNTPEKFSTTTPDQQIEWEWIWREWDRMWKSRKKNSLGCLCLILVLVRQNKIKKKTDRPNHTPCTMCTFNIKKKYEMRQWKRGNGTILIFFFFFYL